MGLGSIEGGERNVGMCRVRVTTKHRFEVFETLSQPTLVVGLDALRVGVGAAPPKEGERLYLEVGRILESEHNLPVAYGIFGAMMQVELTNDGPVTVIIKKEP